MKKYHGFSVAGLIIGIVVVAFIGIATFLVIDGQKKATNFDNYDFYSIIAPDEHNGNIGDHVKKDKDGTYTGDPVLIFEYADPQCSACASLNPRVNQAIDELDGKLAIVFRYDLLNYHQNATAAASAAEATGFQDKDGSRGWWEKYINRLLADQSDWAYLSGSERTAMFEKYFTEVTDGKGDLEKFRSDISSNKISKKISFDMGISKRIDVAGTPAFYVDGQFIPWASKEGGSVTINGKTISWESQLSNSEFVNILKQIVEAKIGN